MDPSASLHELIPPFGVDFCYSNRLDFDEADGKMWTPLPCT
jgi:hypothetical protein